jgi:4-amino-4-deoxy-L-arabinose transferase-like glycosyltransferase
MTPSSLHNPILHWWSQFEKKTTLTWFISIAGLIIINLIAFIWSLGSTGLIDETEPLFAEAARQMTVTGNWITPYFNEATRFDKPPLVYWLIAIAYKIMGVNEWAVRLPSALAAIALMLAVFVTLLKFGYASPKAALVNGEQSATVQRQLWLTAWIGSALTALNFATFAWVHQGVSDMLLSGCMGTALLSFFWGYAQNKVDLPTGWLVPIPNRGYLGFYVLSGLAVLTKGPVGIVLPGLIILAFLVYVGNLRSVLREMGLVWGMLLFLAISVPWFILVIHDNGEAYIDSFFGYHNLERFTSVVNRHSAPWYFYFLIVAGMFAPWSIYLPYSMVRLQFWKRKYWQEQLRQAQLTLFALAWFGVIFVFFTIAVTKLPSYVLPLMPAAAILVAATWSNEFARVSPLLGQKKGFLSSIVLHILLLLAMAIASLLFPHLIGTDPAMINLSGLMQRSSLPVISALIWGITLLLSLILFLKREHWRWIIGVNIVGYLAFLLFFVHPALILVDQVRQLPLREIAAALNQVRQPNESVMMIGFKKPSLNFYSHYQPIGYFWSLDDPAKEFLTELAQNPQANPKILLIGEPGQIAEAGLKPQDFEVLRDRNPYQLIRVDRQRLLAQYHH